MNSWQRVNNIKVRLLSRYGTHKHGLLSNLLLIIFESNTNERGRSLNFIHVTREILFTTKNELPAIENVDLGKKNHPNPNSCECWHHLMTKLSNHSTLSYIPSNSFQNSNKTIPGEGSLAHHPLRSLHTKNNHSSSYTYRDIL